MPPNCWWFHPCYWLRSMQFCRRLYLLRPHLSNCRYIRHRLRHHYPRHHSRMLHPGCKWLHHMRCRLSSQWCRWLNKYWLHPRYCHHCYCKLRCLRLFYCCYMYPLRPRLPTSHHPHHLHSLHNSQQRQRYHFMHFLRCWNIRLHNLHCMPNMVRHLHIRHRLHKLHYWILSRSNRSLRCWCHR